MTTSTTHDDHDDETACEASDPVWPVLLAAGSALFVGYFAGRASFAADFRRAMRRAQEAPEPVEIFVRTL